MKIHIIHRYTKAVLYTAEAENIRGAVEQAVKAGADLRGAYLGGTDLGDAYLGGANLGGADLGGADLRGANLVGANLVGADLRDAYLGGADLRDANLRVANLRGAYLRGADLGGANLGGADLVGAYLRDAYLGGADLGGAYLVGANLRGANLGGADLGGADLGEIRSQLLGDDAPDAMQLRALVADHIEAHPELHNQSDWGDGSANPSCGTPCCVAGWACHLGGGDRGLGVSTAAMLLLSAPGVPLPSFGASAERDEILAALRAKAESQ